MTARRRRDHLWFWLGALVLLVGALALFKDILLPFVAGMVIAYFVNPLADRLQAWGLNRTVATLVLLGLGGVAVVTSLVFLAPVVVAQAKSLAVTLPADAERLRGALEAAIRERFGPQMPGLEAALQRVLGDLQSGWSNAVGGVVSTLLAGGSTLINVVSLLLITPLVVFYLLVDWHRMLDRVDSWLPRDHRETIHGLAGDVNEAVSAFIRGQGTICLMLGAFYAAGLSLAGLRYGLAVGLATGLLAFVPIVGWSLGSLIALALAAGQFGFAPVPLAMVGGVMLAGMALDTAVLSPRIVGEKVGLHPVWLIFALFAFSYLFGFVGTLIAVPLAAAVAVLVRHALKIYLQSDVYLGEAPPTPAAIPDAAERAIADRPRGAA